MSDGKKPLVEFWYEFASTYSYIAAERVEALAAAAGATVVWRPFLLGPLFKRDGMDTSPFNLFPAKGRYMWRDVERLAAAFGLPPFIKPDAFPRNGLLAARVALALAGDDGRPAFSRAVYRAEFAANEDIGDRAVIARILSGLGHDPTAVFARAEAPENKERLKRQTEEAGDIGLFGAPSFTVPMADGTREVFWGSDRVAEAIAWAVTHGAKG